MLTLTVRNGDSEARELSFEKDQIVLGRHENCDVRLDANGVSRKHAIIEKKNGRYTIADAFSANGTVVNSRCISACPINSGDEIVILPFHIVVEKAD